MNTNNPSLLPSPPKKNYTIELIRFVAAILIMCGHASLNIFQTTWVYVELFLIITGYYTASHFAHVGSTNFADCINYTLKKFLVLLPYTITATTLMYLLTYLPQLFNMKLNFMGFIWNFSQDYFFDIFLLISIYQRPLLGTLWYLSTMFIIFPFFVLFVQIHNKYLLMLLSFIVSLIYYGRMDVSCYTGTPICFIRVFAGMCIGVFIYYFTFTFYFYISKINKLFLSLLEFVTFCIPLIATYKNYEPTRFVLLCFSISLTITLSNLSYSSKIAGNLFTYLGKLSVPIYIFHLLFISLFQHFNIWQNTYEKLLCSIITIIISIIALFIVEHSIWLQRTFKTPIILQNK